jgi:hypothetical protein
MAPLEMTERCKYKFRTYDNPLILELVISPKTTVAGLKQALVDNFNLHLPLVLILSTAKKPTILSNRRTIGTFPIGPDDVTTVWHGFTSTVCHDDRVAPIEMAAAVAFESNDKMPTSDRHESEESAITRKAAECPATLQLSDRRAASITPRADTPFLVPGDVFRDAEIRAAVCHADTADVPIVRPLDQVTTITPNADLSFRFSAGQFTGDKIQLTPGNADRADTRAVCHSHLHTASSTESPGFFIRPLTVWLVFIIVLLFLLQFYSNHGQTSPRLLNFHYPSEKVQAR